MTASDAAAADDAGRPGAVPGTAPDDAPDDAAARVIALLTAARLTLAVAESLTGGGVVERLVSVPGASACVRGAVVAYATDLKESVLDVPADLLADHGPVHPDVALAMARGVRTRLGADVGVATTGVAGPDPQGGQPPGTFHVAVVSPVGAWVRSAAVGALGRAQVRGAARDAAIGLVLEALAGTHAGADALEAT